MKKGDRDGQVAQVKQEVGVTKTLFEVEFLQKILNSLGFDAGREDGIYGQQTLNAVSRFQQAHFNTVLKPWGLTAPTGITYQSTEVRLNEVLGCDDSVVLDNGIFVD